MTSDQIMNAFRPFEAFCKVMLDAYVVVDTTGRILKSNPATSLITGVTSKQLMKLDSLDSALAMSLGGRPHSVLDILSSPTTTRIDDIKAKAAGEQDLYLTIGSFPFVVDGAVIGAFILIRDVTAETLLQDKYAVKAEKSITDPLTGLFNRGHFEEYLAVEESRIGTLPVGNDHRNMTIIMGDIDHFKKVNDKYGHPAGDYVIKTVAKIFQQTFRKTDVVCRYGGEEFLVILPASDAAGSIIAANKARQAVESFTFVFEGVTIPVNMSFGVAQMMVGLETGRGTIARADAALYESKKNGRNQVSVHTGNGISVASKTAA
jgi:diguanylate cyclase (GGDEF)-like protein